MTKPTQPIFEADLSDRVLERFVDKFEISDGCWTWTGAKVYDGYGLFCIDGSDRHRRQTSAHRFAFRWLVGPIPDGLTLDHLCRNPSCVNPAHLEPVSIRENIQRSEMVAARIATTHCPRGHPYDDENTYHYRGGRGCKECRRVQLRESRARRRGW